MNERLDTLDCGADAVLTKPVEVCEVAAYLRNLIKRSHGKIGAKILRAGDLCLDQSEKMVKRMERNISLSRKEYEILECLMLNKGRVVSKERLLEQVWEEGFETFSNKLEVHIKGLRDKIDRPFGSKLIKTVHGFGYKLCE